jgi:hypothetical protein
MTAGHNALRGSGPGQKPAFDNAMALVGCPGRRIDRLCIRCCSPSQTLTSGLMSGAISFTLRARLVAYNARPWPSWPRPSAQFYSGNFGRAPPQQRREPGTMLGAVDLGVADDGECTCHEQAAQIAVTLFADAAEPVLAPT